MKLSRIAAALLALMFATDVAAQTRGLPAQSLGPVQTPRLAVTGSGSTGDVSTMSVIPDPLAADASLARILGRTGGTSTNLWFNPDGALGDGSPKVVYNDGLSIYGPRRWIFQQVTLTPYVTGQRVSAADGSTAIRMLNGYAASGSVAIGTGTKTFTVAAGLNFAPGFPVTAVSANDFTKSMTGTVASYSGTSVTLNVTSVSGSGTFSNWTIGASGTTKQGQTKLVTTAAAPAGSTTLTFASTAGVQVGANVEFAFDASFSTVNGIQRGTYVVSKTDTTITLSQPTVSPAGATGGAAVVQGQQVTFYGNQGNYLFQDVQVADATGFRYGTPEAHDAWLSFDVVSNGLPNCTASMMMLGYKSISELGRSYVQSFPVTSTKTRVTIKINGDKVGAAGTWKAGYGANTWGGLWGTIGFVWESQGTPTAQNIPDGQWSNAFAVGGSDQQTCDLTGTVGAFIDVSNVNLTLDKPTPYSPPTEQLYPSPRIEARTGRIPRMFWEATDNPAGLRKWHSYLKPDGTLGFGLLRNDVAELDEVPALILGPTGGATFPGAMTATGTGAFWTTVDPTFLTTYGIPQPAKLGAKINRFSDRVLVGGAVVNSGDFPSTTRDWYETLEAGDTHPGGFRTSWSQFASIATNGGIGVLGAARTSDIQIPTFQLAMGGLFAANNDNVVSQQLATALYAVAFRQAGAGVGTGAGTVGAEFDIANKGNSLKITPSTVDDPRGHTTALKLNSGAAIAGGANAASAALSFGNNRGQFLSGLVVAQNAIAGVTLDASTKATGGEGEALALGAFHSMGWWVTGGGTPSAKIISRQLTAANAQEISFEDTGTYYGGPAGAGRAFATLYPGGSTGAFLTATPASGSNPPILATSGSANSDLRLRSAGTGSLILGNAAADFLTVTSTGSTLPRATFSVGAAAPASITKLSNLGLVIQGGTGTSSDFNVLTPAGTTIFYTPTGTQKVVFGDVIQLPVKSVAALPTCNAANKGTMAVVGDAGTPAYNAAVVGGGVNTIPVLCNGDTWTMH